MTLKTLRSLGLLTLTVAFAVACKGSSSESDDRNAVREAGAGGDAENREPSKAGSRAADDDAGRPSEGERSAGGDDEGSGGKDSSGGANRGGTENDEANRGGQSEQPGTGGGGASGGGTGNQNDGGNDRPGSGGTTTEQGGAQQTAAGQQGDTEGDTGGKDTASGGQGGTAAVNGGGPAWGGSEAGGLNDAGAPSTPGTGGALTCEPAVESRVRFQVPIRSGFGLAMPVGELFVVMADEGLEAYELGTGTRRWAHPRSGYFSASVSDVLYAVDLDGSSLRALEVETGAEVWSAPLSAPGEDYQLPWWSPAGLILVKEVRSLEVFDASTHESLWSFTVSSEGAAAHLGDDGAVYLLESGRFTAFEGTTGNARWSVPLPDVSEFAMAGAPGTRLVDSVSALIAIREANGETAWRYPASGNTESVGLVGVDDEGRPYVLAGTALVALDPSMGIPLWTSELGDIPDSAAVEGDHVVVGLGDDLVAFATETGEEAWRTPVGARSEPPMVLGTGGRVATVVRPEEGTALASLVVLSTEDGSELFSYSSSELFFANLGPGIAWTRTSNEAVVLSVEPDAVDPATLACIPCSRGCQDEGVAECLPDGSGLRMIETCGEGQGCVSGACVDCVPGDHLGCSGDRAVYLYDSCGRAEGIFELCDESAWCSDGVCVSSASCSCSCTCSWCTVTTTVTCTGSPADCTSCQSICAETCEGDPDCGSYVSGSGSCS